MKSQSGFNSPFSFLCGVGVDVHCGTYIRVIEKLLHIFGGGTVRKQIAGVGVPQLVKMEVV